MISVSNWFKNEKIDEFMKYVIQKITWCQVIYIQWVDFNKLVNYDILLDDFKKPKIRWFQSTSKILRSKDRLL